jgi:hypothetical protein
MNLKGIGQVDINWKAKRRHLQSMIDDATLLQALLIQPLHES